MNFKNHRPDNAWTPTDKQLSQIAQSIRQFLLKEPSMLLSFLDQPTIGELAVILTEFGEDTWYEIGMWKALEDFNKLHFGNPLPFSKPENVEYSDFPFDEYRLSHLLWNAMMIWYGMEILSPHHPELLPLAERLSEFMEKQFDKLPKQSSVAKFLATPNKSGTDVKRKLVWMGTKSYLFRTLCHGYLKDRDAMNLGADEQIPYIDDFLCQECTLWSGMGVLDVLAHTLPFTESQRNDVLSWYERHYAYYEIIGIDKDGTELKNLFTNQVYHLPDEKPSPFSPFKKGMNVAGSTVPYDGGWYWSGVQYKLGNADEFDLPTFKMNFYQKSPGIVYRYDKKRAAKAIEQMKGYQDAFEEFFGNDLVVFKTGKEAAKALFEKIEFQQKKILGEKGFEQQKEKFRQAGITAESSFSPEFLEHDGGICVFHNSGIGEEMTTYFFDIKKSLLKKGKELTPAEIEQLQDFFTDRSVSKELIERLAAEFAKESFAVIFFLHKKPKYWFKYLLRKFKGQDFRNRYPNLAIVDSLEER